MKHEYKIKLLKTISKKLGDDWAFNELLSSKDGNCNPVYFLTNKKGLYLSVMNEYGSTIEKWRLYVDDPTGYERKFLIFSIGCSLKKCLKNIVSDIKNRLLVKEKEAYQKYQELKEKKQKNTDKNNNRDYVINAISKVIPIRTSNNRNGSGYTEKTFYIYDGNSEIGRIQELFNKVDLFKVSLESVTSEQLIKIYSILK